MPADVYTRSPRSYRGLEESLSVATMDATIKRMARPYLLKPPQDQRQCRLRGTESASQVSDGSGGKFMDYDLGYFDDDTCRLEPIANSFAAKVLTMARNEVLTHAPEWTEKYRRADRSRPARGQAKRVAA